MVEKNDPEYIPPHTYTSATPWTFAQTPPKGAWVAACLDENYSKYYMMFSSELDALRYAINNNAKVKFFKWGERINEEASE